MKREVIMLFTVVFLLVGAFGCSNDSHETPNIRVEGENTVIRVKILDATKTMTRAAGTATEPATTDEKEITGDVTILVYDADNNLEKTHADEITNGESTQFTIQSGKKHIYVVANQTVGGTTGVKAENTAGAYERQNMDAAISGDPEALSIASNSGFIIGTLWGEEVDIASGGTEDEPIEITLEIGRAAAKAKLHSVQKGTTSNMAGQFTNPHYRIGSIATEYYHVGQYEGTTVPPEDDHGKVTSAVHTQPWYETNPESETQNTVFTNYEQWMGVTALPTEGNPLTNFFYVTENTTALDQQSLQYYGNTTYVQLRTVYIPDPDEVLDVNNLSETVTIAEGETFWVVTIDKVNYLVGNYGAATEETQATITATKQYPNGMNYHKFPIRDKSESDPEKMNAVLRNHYYEIAVNSIKDLGEPGEEVDPWIPITTETNVEATITILPWSKISQGEDL